MPINADETHTVRLPSGVAKRLKAATGQPFSRLVRFMCMSLLEKYEAEAAAASIGPTEQARVNIDEIVQNKPLPPANGAL